MVWLIVAAAALALGAGLCASAEVALMRVSRSGAGELARGRKGSRRRAATRLQAVLAEPARYLAVLLLARICGETAAIVLVAAALLHWLGTGWHVFLLIWVIMAAVLYVLAGIGPRILGRQYERSVALAAADVLYPVTRILGPLPRLLLALGSVLTPGRGSRDAFGTEEELRGLVDLLEQRQVIEPGARAMIHSVFELGDTIVREVMVPRTDMVFVERAKTLRQALSLALRSGFSRVPVVGENQDDVIGIAYLKDLVTISQEHPEQESVATVTSVMRPATFVPESKPVDELLREMQQLRIHLAIVIDEYGGTAGLVTIEDILEEIVGEITDEYDHEQPTVEWLSPDRARVTARLPVTDLEELFGTTIEAEDVETVGGLLAHALGRVPIAGSEATVAGLKLTAESLAGRRNRIGTVTVERAGVTARQPAVRPGDEAEQASGQRRLRLSSLGHTRRAGTDVAAGRATTLGQVSAVEPGPEDLKIITLARSARARVAAAEGAAVRDETGRTYAAAAVSLPSLELSALRLAVAMAVSSGAASLEAAALVTDAEGVDPADLAVVREAGPSAVVFQAGPNGMLRATVRP